MFKRHSTTTQLIAWLVCLTIILPVQYAAADPWVCLAELDGDGDASSDGEMVGCVPASGTQFCPLQAVDCTQTGTPATCPVAGNACVNGVCDTPGFCHYEDIGLGAWECELPNGIQGGQYPTSSQCNSACSNFQSPCSGGGNAYTCPLGGAYACVDHFGTQQCSPNACNDLATAPPPTETPLDGAGQMFLDDGPRDVDGNCMGATMIFSGRAMECLPRGLRPHFSRYRDCDRTGHGVAHESVPAGEPRDGGTQRVRVLRRAWLLLQARDLGLLRPTRTLTVLLQQQTGEDYSRAGSLAAFDVSRWFRGSQRAQLSRILTGGVSGTRLLPDRSIGVLRRYLSCIARDDAGHHSARRGAVQ